MVLRLLHTSDTHGMPAPITHRDIDVVVHSGDLCPDPPAALGKVPIKAWQRNWVSGHLDAIKEWLDGRPLLFCGGNHDWCGGEWFEQELRRVGIDATCLHDKLVGFRGYSFYGVPYIPYICGTHAYELEEEGMIAKLDEMVATISAATYTDVVVAHCPPADILDEDLRTHIHWGNILLNEALFEEIDPEKGPSTVLIGHCHSSHGVRHVNEKGRSILFVNSATTQHTIELE